MTREKTILQKILAAEDNPSADAKYIHAVRKSSLASWFERCASMSASKMPVPKVGAADKRRVTRLADEMAELKAADPDADADFLKWQIDYVVHELYRLTDDETTTIYRSLGLTHQTDEEEDAAILKSLEEAEAIDDPCDFVSGDSVSGVAIAHPTGAGSCP